MKITSTSNYQRINFQNKNIDNKCEKHYTTPKLGLDTFKLYSKASRISFMSNEINNDRLYKKINEIFLEGIEEPEYTRTDSTLSEESQNYVIKSFYDENDVLRKETWTKISGLPYSLELFNSDGNITYSARSNVNFYAPIVEIRRTYFDGSENEEVKDSKLINLNIQTLNT